MKNVLVRYTQSLALVRIGQSCHLFIREELQTLYVIGCKTLASEFVLY